MGQGPGAYRVPTFLEEVRGGVTFLKDVGGSMMDKIVERAAAIPGPSRCTFLCQAVVG